MKTCQKCGFEGEFEQLVYCVKCKESAEHRYCLNVLPKFGVYPVWTCEECRDAEAAKLIPVSCRISDCLSLRNDTSANRSRQQHCSSARAIHIIDRLKEAKQPVNDNSVSHKEIKGLKLGNGTLQSTKKKIFSDLEEGEISDEEDSEQGKVESSQIPQVSETASSLEEGKEVKVTTPEANHPLGDNPSLEADRHVNVRSFEANPPLGGSHSANEEPSTGNGHYRQRKRLVLEDEEIFDKEFEQVENSNRHLVLLSCSKASMIACDPSPLESKTVVSAPVWKGCFSIVINGKKGTTFRMVAHLSTRVSTKVHVAVATFPPLLDVEIALRLDAWPQKFKDLPPTADDVALFFFPKYDSDEKVYDGLLDEIIEHDLALRAFVDNIEILIFSSRELPEEHWRIMRKYYLWAVCRRRLTCP